MIKPLIPGAALALGLTFSASALAAPVDDVVKNYADIALAGYEDSLITARTLEHAVDALLAQPNGSNLVAARAAWRAARVPYQQTEVFRFGNPEVDDWEGKVNAWPLDEGLIDYVDGGTYGDENEENPFYTANVVAREKISAGGVNVDAANITPAVIESLHELDGVESNVATGYHAIEFLLWGQDLNGTGPGAGNRPASDFDTANCSGGHCDRRGAYLKAATTLLIQDLGDMITSWSEGGAARTRLLNDPQAALVSIVTGMGSLSYGELAGERMKLGLMLHDPEEEHDCFSDNTHWSHYYDVLGVRNVYSGHYRRVDGSRVIGPSISELVAARDAKADATLKARLNAAVLRFQALADRAESVESYDQMLGSGNAAGNAVVESAVQALIDQTKAIEIAVSALGLDSVGFEGSDSLDNPAAVQ
ncbi:MAG: imelysin family protein [Gammaproteobacteria bacterium]